MIGENSRIDNCRNTSADRGAVPRLSGKGNGREKSREPFATCH